MKNKSWAVLVLSLFSLLLAGKSACAQWNELNPITDARKEADGVVFTMKTGTMKLQVCSESIVRVLYSPTSAFPDRPEFVVIKKTWPATQWSMQAGNDSVVVTTPELKITVTRKDGNVLFADATGKKLFEDYGRRLTPVVVNGENTYHA